MKSEAFLDFTSGYVQRAAASLPIQGERKPWKLNQNYALDVMALKFGSVDDAMRFSNPASAPARPDALSAA
jgi:monooxygenase